ncbi:MAG: hypothetical protein ACD_39C00162G0002 [uncultured bacterium]|nr:MAG: hypothetical protein ACD_39C00162G0002 [uncultured bacterium]
MKNNEIPFFLGYVEQAIGGGQDPLNPSISISRNGSLAKWRGKLNFLDLRVNDPGLKKNAAAFEQVLQKAEALAIKTIITLPEYSPVYFDLPPEPKPKVEEPVRPVRRGPAKATRLTHFKPAYLALPSAIQGHPSYYSLSVEECLPVIELAARHAVKDIIVPVSEPGVFLDPQAEVRFKKAFKEIHAAAASASITLHLRNGGISFSVFRKLAREFGCKLAYDVGISHLEGDDILDIYQKFDDLISIISLHQVLPGLDKFGARREAMERALKEYISVRNEYRQSIEDKDEHYSEKCLKRFNFALKDYQEACRNPHLNLGLYQSGDLNLVPLLKEIRRSIEGGAEKHVLLAMVPNTRNNDFVVQKLAPENFSGAF